MLSVPIKLKLILPTRELPLTDSYLHYRPADPYAVTLDIVDPETGQRRAWIMSRELLTNGVALTAPRELGDVDIWRLGKGDLCVHLHSPEGTSVLRAKARQIEAFLAVSYAMVPLDHEMDAIDIDSEISSIMGAA